MDWKWSLFAGVLISCGGAKEECGEGADCADTSDTDVADTDTDTDADTDADTDTDTDTDTNASCDPLDVPQGNQVVIASGDVSALVDAVNTAQVGDVILLEDGIFSMGGQYLWIDVEDITLRSQSGNRSAVIIDGEYSTTEIVTVAASNVTVAHLTLSRAYTHGVHVVGGDAADTTGTVLYDIHVLDPGEQAIKVNTGPGTYPDNGLIACSHLELTDSGRPQIRNNCYTGGVDSHQTRGWSIRDNLVEGFWCESGLSEHGIHMWRSNAETVIERNVIRNCARGIGLGLTDQSAPNIRTYADISCGNDYVDDYRGTVRNNTVFANDSGLFASDYGFDTGIALAAACESTVVHNTVFSTQAPFSSIEWRFDPTSAYIANNIVSHNLMERTPGIATLESNLDGADSTWFVDASNANLHLDAAAPAVNAGAVLTAGMCETDIDQEPRSDGSPDVGADEI